MTIEKKVEMIADRYGYEPQSRQCIEEMAELTQAINKLWRKQNFGGNKEEVSAAEDAVLDEMADTLIMLWQMKYLLGFGEGQLHKRIEDKLDRQLQRIFGGNHEKS